MTIKTLRLLAYATSLLLILAGEIAVFFLFRDDPLLPYILIGFPVIGLFFLGMKLTLVKNLALSRRSTPDKVE